MLKQMLTAALLATATATLAPAPAHADKAPVYTGLFNNLAVEGHDPVAYFT